MKTCFAILAIFFILNIASGQESHLRQAEKIKMEMDKNPDSDSQEKKSLNEKDIAGTQYLDKNFQESYILKVNGIEIKDMLLRYNIYSDNMEFRKDGQIFVIAFPSEIHRVKLNGKAFIYEQYQLLNKVAHGYFEVLREGDFQLLKKYITKLKIPEKRDNEDSLRFVRQSPAYYFRRGEGKIYLIGSQKQLVKVIQPVHQPVIDFIKTNKINGKDESKLISLMEFLEENEN